MKETLLGLFQVLIGVAIPLASFATGLRSTDPLWLWKRPRLLARALFVILLVVPLLTVLLVEVLSPGNVYVRAGIVVSIFSIGIGPPDLLKRTRSVTETTHYEIGLDEALLVLAIVYMPAAVALHGAVFHHDVQLSWFEVAKVVMLQALLPLFAGVGVARLFPRAAAAIGRPAERFVNAAMLVVVLFALLVAWRALLALGLAAWLTCAAVAIAAILVGHALGGPKIESRGVLASYSAVRFPGLALLLVSVVSGGKRLIPFVLAYIITSAVLVGVYQAAMTRRHKSVEARAGT